MSRFLLKNKAKNKTDLGLVAIVLLVIRVEQVCNAIVWNLGSEIIIQEYISGSQVPVNHPVLFQVIHTLTGESNNGGEVLGGINQIVYIYIKKVWHQTKIIKHFFFHTFAIWTHQLSSLCGLSLPLFFFTCASSEPCLLSGVTSCRLLPGQIPRVLTTLMWFRLAIILMCCSNQISRSLGILFSVNNHWDLWY